MKRGSERRLRRSSGIVCRLPLLLLATTASGAESPEAGSSAPAEVVVNGILEREGNSSSKLPVPLLDLPLSQQSVDRELIDERGLQRIEEAVDSVAGVRRVNGYPGGTGYYVRGFFEGYDLLRDGFRDTNYGASDLIGIERIDVLKGPASVLYSGNLSAGGVINLVSSTPQLQPQTRIDAAAGSFGYWRGTVDSTGPLDRDGDVLYRIGAAAQSSGDFRDFLYNHQWAITPSLRWKATAADEVLLQAEYLKSDFVFPADLPMSPAALDIPPSRYLLQPGMGGSSSRNRRVRLDYEHAFSPNWKLRVAGNTAHVDLDIGIDRLYYPTLDADGRTLPRPLSAGPQSTANDELQAEIYGRLVTGDIQHQLVGGFNAFREIYDSHNDFSDLGAIDIFAPVYSSIPISTGMHWQAQSSTKAAAVFLQDLVSLGDFELLAAIRRERMSSYSADIANGTSSTTHDWVSTYRVGAVYEATPQSSLYVSTSSSFVPNIYYQSVNGGILQPTTGRQWEAGYKQEWLQRRLSATAALFDIRRRHVPTADLDNPGFSVNRGEQRSRGVELELAGLINPDWHLTASYAFTDATVTKDDSLPIGDRLAGVPRNSLSLWSTYEFPSRSAQRFGAGFGVYYNSSVETTLPNTFMLDSNTRLDGLVYYRNARGLRVALNIKNLTDVRYYDTDGAYTLRPNAPRTFVVSTSLTL